MFYILLLEIGTPKSWTTNVVSAREEGLGTRSHMQLVSGMWVNGVCGSNLQDAGQIP